jgi:1-acyl-sn-glycerol-3-phosphate acyltransferase
VNEYGEKRKRVFGGPAAKGWFYRWRRRVFRLGIWNLLYRFWIRLHVDGWENIPADGPLIMMGNHISNLDPVIMISFYPDRDIVPLAKIEAFSQPVLRYFVGHWGAIPVHRGAGDTTALKLALQQISLGNIVMFYAEGTRSKTGLIEGKVGTAALAIKTDAAVVPVAIWGSRDFPGTWIKDFRRTPVYIRFGRPFKFRSEGRKVVREDLQIMIDEAMYQIARLLPPEWRGIYSDLTKATTAHLDFDLAWRPARRKMPGRVTRWRQVTQARTTQGNHETA